MTERDDIPRLLAEITAELSPEEAPEQLTQRIVLQALELIDADAASLTAHRKGEFQTLASTAELARRCDELQYTLDEGPCVEAAEEAEWYRSGDIGHDHRWPRWGRQAAELGVGSMLSIRLLAGGLVVGALNLYGFRTGMFSDRDEVDLALLFSIHVGPQLRSSEAISGMQSALSSRHTIGVAQGILMQAHGIDVDQSFALLRRYSVTLNRKLRDLAEEVVLTRNLPRLGNAPATQPDQPVAGSRISNVPN